MGYPVGADRQDLGFLRRAVQGQRVQVPAAVRQLRDGKRAVQDLVPGRVPLADRGRGGDDDPRRTEANSARPRRTSGRSRSARTRRASASSTRRGRSTIRPTATTASSTWWRCRSSSAASRPADYEDKIAADPRIDALRDKIVCVEDKQFTKDYHDPNKRSIANALTVEFTDGKKLKEVVVEYPIGHKRRRKEGMPVLVEKFRTNLARVFPPSRRRRSSTCASTRNVSTPRRSTSSST